MWQSGFWADGFWQSGFWAEESIALPASLGGIRNESKQKITRVRKDDEIASPLPESVISRIETELLAGVLADDVILRARKRKTRAEEEAFLLMI